MALATIIICGITSGMAPVGKDGKTSAVALAACLVFLLGVLDFLAWVLEQTVKYTTSRGPPLAIGNRAGSRSALALIALRLPSAGDLDFSVSEGDQMASIKGHGEDHRGQMDG